MGTMRLTCRPLVISLTLSLLLWSRVSSAKDVFASSAHLKMLADGERDLVDSLRQYIDEEHNRLDQIDILLLEVRAVHNSFSTTSPQSTSAERLTANPIQAFQLIKRFATTWRYIWALASNFTAYEGLKATSELLADHIPSDTDVSSAMLSLIRLRKTYDLPINDLIHGHVAGYQAPPLEHTMAFDFALICLGNGEPNEAIQWLTYASSIASGDFVGEDAPKMVPLSIIYQAFARAYAQKQDFLTALEYTRKAIELEPTNGGFLVDILPPSNFPVVITSEEPEWRQNYFRLCRETAYSNSYPEEEFSTDNQLDCQFQRSRISPLQRHKVEFLHRSPDIVLVHDIVSDTEAEKLKQLAVTKIVRAKIGSSMESTESEVRVGKIAWFYDDQDDVIVSRISARVGDVTGLNVTFPSTEPLQMSNYGLGGHYEPHFDHDEHRFKRDQQPQEVVDLGDRIATLMIYLNDVTVGGATVFTTLNLGLKPVKNAAVFWYNYKSSGSMDPLALHAACPVLIGEKWVANKWIREFGQEFNRPCSLNEDTPSQYHVTMTSYDR